MFEQQIPQGSIEPEGDQPALANAFFLTGFYGWGLALHLLLLLVVPWMGEPVLMSVALGLLGLCGLGYFLLRWQKWNALTLFIGIEGFVYIMSTTYCFGWKAGFHLHTFQLVVAVLMFDHLSRKKRITLGLLPIICFAGLFPLMASLNPPFPQSTAVTLALYTANGILLISGIMLTVLYFIRSVYAAKREAERQSEARGRLIADMSHELKTPLSAMMLRIQSTLKHGSEVERHEALLFCERNARVMASLSHRMLDFVYQGDALSESSLQHIQMVAFISECIELIEPAAKQKNVRLNLIANDPVSLESDPVYLRSILNNLLSNAIRHGPKNSQVTITLKVNSVRVQVAVADTGEGIDESDIPHIFDPFYRTDKARSRAEGSVGLGLTIAQEYAQRLGGQLSVESEPGQGSIFTLDLPFRKTQASYARKH